MISPEIPINEDERLASLQSYDILDTLPEQAYDDITKIASQICNTPISLVSLVDESRQWFKSHHGLDATETPRDIAYCAHAINKPNEILEVQDAFKDKRFHDNPLATGDPHVRFYAGAPLIDDQGYSLGTLCVIDNEPKQLTADQKESLWALSRQVVSQLQLRKEIIRRKEIYQDYVEMMSNLGDGVFELDRKGRITYVNSTMLKYLNRSISQVKNTSIWKLIHPEDVEDMKEFYASHFRKLKTSCYYEYRIQVKGGQPIWLGQNTTMQYDDHGQMIKLRSIARDLTEHKELEKEVQLKREQFKLVSENSSDLIALHNPEGIYQFVSPSSTELIGHKPEELIGKSPYSFIHPDDVKRLQDGPHAKTLAGKEVKNIDYRMQKKDGSYVWMESYTRPIFGEHNEVIAFQTSSRDITEKNKERELLKVAKQDAEKAAEAKSIFLSMMSHEIRTPLNGVIGTTHLLIENNPRKNQINHLNILKNSGENLMAIVNDILDFSKIEEGKVQLERTPFNLQDLAQSIISNYSIQAKKKGIDLSINPDLSIASYYYGDSTRIGQVLHNLVSNAIKFTEQGEVTLTIRKTDQHDDYDEIYFVIKDTGVGIPKEKQNEIFDVFTQADLSTTRKFGGSGLGLSICQQLLKLMNSEIYIDSSTGEGAEFYFSLILQKSEAGDLENSDEFKYEQLDGHILLVEDNAFNKEIAKDFLTSWGFKVSTASNGREALDILKKQKIDLVLLDLQMPIMDGFETIVRIRKEKDAYYQKLPVLALTASVLMDVRQRVFEVGMNDFITKPFQPMGFYLKVKDQLYRKETKIQDYPSMIIEKLKDTVGNDESKLKRYLDIFMLTLSEECDMLEIAMSHKDSAGIRTYTHKNKSSFRLAGLSEVADELEEMEQMIDDNIPLKEINNRLEKHSKTMRIVLNSVRKWAGQ